jgi:hypothetical protein
MRRHFVPMIAAVVMMALLAAGRPARADSDWVAWSQTCRTPDVTAAIQRLHADRIVLPNSNSELSDPIVNGVTRAEVAVYLVRILGREPESGQRTNEARFVDLKGHWAAGLVAVLADEGVVKGYPDGTFEPDRKVSRPEAELMMARMLRLGAELTLESAGPALRGAGVNTELPPCGPESLAQGQLYLLLDRFRRAEAWSVR